MVEKDGGGVFTDADKEILVPCAAQAAAAIANVRAYRDEQHGRADLEALVETSPVGVSVFDAAAGRAVSVTLQDLAPLEELDRMRAEFLGMRSPEPASPRRRHLPPQVPLRRVRPDVRRLTCRLPPTDRAGQRGKACWRARGKAG